MTDVIFRDSGPKPLPPGRLRRAFRFVSRHPVLWGPFLAVLAYLGAVRLLSAVMVDETALRRVLTAQLEYVLGTDVDIDSIEARAGAWGGCTIRLRGVRVECPSPDFSTPPDILMIRKVTLEGGLLDFFGSSWEPEVTVTDWELQVAVARDGATNLADLFHLQGTEKEIPEHSFLRLRREVWMRNGRVRLYLAETGTQVWESLPLHGRFTLREEDSGHALEIDLYHWGASREALDPEQAVKLDARQLVWKDGALAGRYALHAFGKDLPAAIANRLLQLPGVDSAQRFATYAFACDASGVGRAYRVDANVTLTDRPFRLFGLNAPFGVRASVRRGDVENGDGELDSAEPTLAAIRFHADAARCAVTPYPGDMHSFFTPSASDDAEAATDVRIGLYPGDMAVTMSIRTEALAALYIPSVVSVPDSWGSALLPLLRRVTVSADKADILGVPVTGGALELGLDGGAIAKLALRGRLAGGALTLDATDMPLDGGSPGSLSFRLEGADAGALLGVAALLMPRTAVPGCSGGAVDVAMSYARDEALRRVRVDIRTPVVIPPERQTGVLGALGMVGAELVKLAPASPDAGVGKPFALVFAEGTVEASFATNLRNLAITGSLREKTLGRLALTMLERGVRKVEAFDVVLEDFAVPAAWPVSEAGRAAAAAASREGAFSLRASVTGDVSTPYLDAVRARLAPETSSKP